MIRPRSVLPVTMVALLVACIGTVENPPPQDSPPAPPAMASMGPNQEAADRVLNTMKEIIAAAEELVALREESLQSVETQFEAGRRPLVDVASARAQLWEARIRALNYKQELYTAQASMPQVLETMREKVVAADKVVEIREGIVGETRVLIEAGRETTDDLPSVRSRLLEDRIWALKYRQDLYYAEAIFGMAREAGQVK